MASSASGSSSKLLRSFVRGRYVQQQSAASASVAVCANPTSTFRLYKSWNGEATNHFYSANKTQVEEAVAAAREVQQEWYKGYGPAQRAAIMRKAADLIMESSDKMSQLETMDTGRPIAETTSCDIPSATDCLYYYSGVAPAHSGGQAIPLSLGNESWSYTRREPLGVTVGIGAWNYPLQSAIWKSAPALTFGNTMVFKPSEYTPSTALALAEIYKEAGMPDGVFNVVLGEGSTTGEYLCQHPSVAKISFTGSVATGTRVYTEAAKQMKKVTMELGGKSPLIIFDDSNLENAVSATMMANWYSSGQVCSNGTRVFVHSSIAKEFTNRLVERTRQLQIGNPLKPTTEIGPMIHKQQMNKVLDYIKIGQEQDGATLLYGGQRLGGAELEKGYYVSPAIFTNCTDDMMIVRDEIFGMVLCLLEFNDEEEVIQRANNTPFGLSAGVFTSDIQRAHRVVARLEAGTTWINNYNLAPVETPWGGYKASGIGRENGLAGIDSWTQLKSVYVEMSDTIDCPYK